jgi:hypothetical protein
MIMSQQRPAIKTKHPRRVLLPSCLLLLCFLLVACGGDETAAPEAESPGSTTVVVPTPIEAATDTAQSLPASPTALQPTDVPPTPAAATATTEIATSVATGMPEATYTAEPVDQGGGGFGPGGSAAGGNCTHPYFPIADGSTYRYRNTDSLTGETEYTVTYSETTDDNFTAMYNFGEGDEATSFSQTFQCTDEGIFSPGPLRFPEEMGVEMEFEVVEASGLTLPVSSRLEPGETWTTRYVVQGTGENEGLTFQWNQTMEFTNEVVAIEPVSVPAGDYPAAVRVDSTGTVSIVTTIGDTEAPLMSFDLDQSTWYVENVGMVRQEASDLFGDSAEAMSVVELLEIGD